MKLPNASKEAKTSLGVLLGHLRPGTQNQFRPLIDSCEKALCYPHQDVFVNKERGQSDDGRL
ncbi:MAG: hypothetical protein ACAI44_12600 [Candidatus Sericytochromatia bacterium]